VERKSGLLSRFKKAQPFHIHPEDGNCNACRNVGEFLTFDATHPLKTKSHVIFLGYLTAYFNCVGCIPLDGRMIMNNELERSMEGSGRDLLKVLSPHFPISAEEMHGNVQSQ
jgi:hypothetical protein